MSKWSLEATSATFPIQNGEGIAVAGQHGCVDRIVSAAPGCISSPAFLPNLVHLETTIILVAVVFPTFYVWVLLDNLIAVLSTWGNLCWERRHTAITP